MLSNHRFILYHKHPSSGRTLFLRLADTVCQFGGISPDARVVESHVGGDQVKDNLVEWLTDTEQRWGMDRGTLKVNQEFNVTIADVNTPVQIYLAQFTTVEPPQEPIAEQAGKFIALTEARRLPATELELLRLAYSAIMDDLA